MKVLIVEDDRTVSTLLEKIVQLGARHYLVKPCTLEKVKAKLQQLQVPLPVGGELKLCGH